MNNAELIKALRWCGSEDEAHEMCVDESYSCPMWNEDRMADYCKAGLMLAAARLIEAQQKRIAELEAELPIVESVREDALMQRIAELEAQLPKDGEWNIRETASGDVEAKCPKCGFEMLVNQPGNGLLMVSELLYCPHCGSRMAKGEQNG